jgi:poly(rC)-binding protein 2/3/4
VSKQEQRKHISRYQVKLANMSTSPQHTSTKRPLEETSSPSRSEQPDAKRPALDKIIKDEEDQKKEEPSSAPDSAEPESTPAAAKEETNGTTETNGEEPTQEGTDAQGDTIVPDAPDNRANISAANVAMTQQTGQPANAHDETAWIHVRAVISSPEAATVIGKGGENVSKIRHMSGAKCTVSDYQKGAIERILTVSGVVDAVAKVSAARRTFKPDIELTESISGLWPDRSNSEQRASY